MRARLARRRRPRSGCRCLPSGWSSVLLNWLLNGGLEGYERAIPKALQISTQGSQPTRVELVDAVLAGAPVDDQARVFQHLEVLRDRRAAHGELVRQLGYSPRAFSEAL